MNSRFSFLIRKIYLLSLLLCCAGLVSCGLRTAPQFLPEEIPKSTFNDLKVQQRDQRIRLSLRINKTEKKKALKRLSEDQGQQDYFLLQILSQDLDCRDCEIDKKPPIHLLNSSNSIIHEGDNLFYYLELPQDTLKIFQYQLSHMGPGKKLLSPVQTVLLKQSNKFPEVFAPELQLVQIEDEKRIIHFAFGKITINKTTVVVDKTEKLLEQKNGLTENPEVIEINIRQKPVKRALIVRLSWPLYYDRGLNRLKGKGEYFEKQNLFQVYLYRTRSGEAWPEIPINRKSVANNYFLDKLNVYIPPITYPHMTDTHPGIISAKLSFFIDLLSQNRDTWLYQLRLVDSFGNESSASETISFKSPETMILGQSYGRKAFVPLSD